MFYTFFFTTFSKKVETHFGTQFGIRAAQEGQDEPIRTIRSFKEQKTFIYKNLKKPIGFWRFLAVEASQESLKMPKMAPKRHPQNPRPQKIGIQNRTQKLQNIGNHFLEPTLKTKHSQNKPEKNAI